MDPDAQELNDLMAQEQDESAMEGRGIVVSERARAILSIGPAENPREEDTTDILIEGEEAQVFRLLRRRHLGGEDPMIAADRWAEHVKAYSSAGLGTYDSRRYGLMSTEASCM